MDSPFRLAFSRRSPWPGRRSDGLYALCVFAALASTLWIAVYFTTAIRRYVDRAHAELRQKEKLLGIGQLVAGIAHQIANPLDGVQNCLQRIGERVRDDPHLTEYVQMMVAALDRIERTAKRVQSFALPRGITLQAPTSMRSSRRRCRCWTPPRASKVASAPNSGTCRRCKATRTRLQEVLFNLCTNAFAAMPSGGTLTLRTRLLGGHDEDQMDSVAIEVADTGVGIPRANLEKIFEPFFTTRADSGGTGLGLGLCRMLISEMGGRIEVRSVLNQGTVFTVVLNPAGPWPAAPEPLTAVGFSKSIHMSNRVVVGVRMRILVADDEKIKRVTLAQDMESQGHEVVTAADGAEALEQLLRGPLRRRRDRPENAQARRHRAAEADQARAPHRRRSDHHDRLRQHPAGRRGGEAGGLRLPDQALPQRRHFPPLGPHRGGRARGTTRSAPEPLETTIGHIDHAWWASPPRSAASAA